MDEISHNFALALDAMLDASWIRARTDGSKAVFSGTVRLTDAKIRRQTEITVSGFAVANEPRVILSTNDSSYIQTSHNELSGSHYELLLFLAHVTGSTPPPEPPRPD